MLTWELADGSCNPGVAATSDVSASDTATVADVFKAVSPSDTLSDQAILGTMADICYTDKNNTYYTAM